MDQQEREHLIQKAENGLSGQGSVVKALFVLDDSINALERISTKLNKVLIWLTGIGVALTIVIVIDIVIRWWHGS